MPSRWGWCLGLTADPFQTGSILTQGEWAWEETDMILPLLKPGDTVIDAGANIGSITLALAAAVGSAGAVYSFEPQRHPYMCLCANVALNSLTHFVRPVRAAVGAAPGSIDVPILDPTVPVNFGGVSLLDKHTTPIEKVPLLTIDSLALPACSLIKADVEGMEAAVIQGAAQTIGQFRPIIWAEQLDHRVETSKDLKEVLTAYSYRAWKVFTKLFNPNNARRQSYNMFKFPDGTPMNDQSIFAIHRDSEPPEWTKNPNVERFLE